MSSFRFATLFLLMSTSSIYAADQFVSEKIPLPEETIKILLTQEHVNDCPKIADQLIELKLSYYGFDDQPHQGIIIVNKAIDLQVINIFKALFGARYHIAKLEPYSITSNFPLNNATVGYYCAKLPIPESELESHAEGKAIDINPMQNPYVNRTEVWPIEAANNVTRNDAPGVIREGHKTYNIFAAHQWEWGGLRQRNPNYMHFEAPKMNPYAS
jgi:hypothetical protein